MVGETARPRLLTSRGFLWLSVGLRFDYGERKRDAEVGLIAVVYVGAVTSIEI